MNWYIKLLAVGFLLWDQNNVTSGQSSTTKASRESDPQTPSTTVSPKTTPPANTSAAAIPALTTPLTSSHSNSSDGAPITHLPDSSSRDLTPTSTSSAALTPLTANSTSTQHSPPDNSNTTATQASTVPTTMELTSAFTATSGPSSSDNVTSPAPTTSAPPSTTGDPLRNCSFIEFKGPTYKEKVEELNLSNFTLGTCSNISSSPADYTFKLQNFFFNVSKCEPQKIECSVVGCRNNISFTLDAPPDGDDYTVTDKTKEEDSITFIWQNQHGKKCSVSTQSSCTDISGKTNDTVIGETKDAEYRDGVRLESVVHGLQPYTNYSCTSRVLYNGSVLNTISAVIETKVGAPGPVRNLNCFSTISSISCEWKEPETRNGPLSGYIVKKNSTVKQQTSSSSFTLTGLEPFEAFKISVSAYNDDNGSSLSGQEESKTLWTKAGKPSVVSKVIALIDKHNHIVIKCNAPQNIKGLPGDYVLLFNEEEEETNAQCKFIKHDLYYLTTYKYKIFYRNFDFKNIRNDGEIYEGEITTRYNDKALIGFLAFLITVTCLALIIVLYKIYKLKQKSSRNNEDSIPLTNPDDERQLLNIEPIQVEHLLETYKRKNADEGRLFLDEFQSIPRVFSKFPIKEARKSYNQPKNRYIDILPYDENRVVLSEVHGDPGSDYINASYVNGFKEPRKYIAAQGPKEETMTDFWRMIWEQKSTIIVMVTRCEEGNRNKCAQYWPSEEGRTEVYGDTVVKLTQQKLFPDYIIRKLHVSQKREKTERDITHIQFTVWPDHGVPDDPNLLLKLRRRVNALSNFFSGPIIVHCSAGVGRTGTYISIDAMLEGLEAEGRVDVYGYVVQLRRQRCLMVQVESQYIFIHKALVEYNQFGETEVSMAELSLILNNLKKKDSPSEPSQLMCEFQRLPSYRNWRPQTTGKHQDNKDKNRSSVVPYEFNRVQVKIEEEPEQEVTDDSEMSSDDDSDCEDCLYINASYIAGYWGTREIIAAQAPLKNTLPEFWKMIFQKKVKAIVMLSGPNQENVENNCAPYWKEKNKTYDDFHVELTSEKSCGSFTERCFQIRYAKRKDVRKVSQFHYEQWEEVLPTETKALLDMITQIKKNIPSRSDEQCVYDKSVPLVVHCSDGSQLTGTFSALWNLLESADVEGVIDVFQSVKNLRRQRSGVVSSFEQYQFLYDVLVATVPAQNGQVKSANKHEVKLQIVNELEGKIPEADAPPAAAPEEETSKPKDDDTNANGTSPGAFTDVTLRIDE